MLFPMNVCVGLCKDGATQGLLVWFKLKLCLAVNNGGAIQ
jgi:hypothetical protein